MAQQQQQPQQQVQPSYQQSQRSTTPRYQQQQPGGQSTGRYGSAGSGSGQGGQQTGQQTGGQFGQQGGRMGQQTGQQTGGQFGQQSGSQFGQQSGGQFGQQGGQMGQQGGQIGQQTGQIGQQTGGQQTGQTTGGQMPIQFEDALTPEMRQALEEFTKVEKVCEWAVEQSLGRGIPEAVRVLRDIADLAEVNERLLVRSSTVGPHVAEAFVKAASQALVELQQYSQPHIVQTTNVIARSLDSTQKLLTSIGWTGGQQTGQSGQQGTQFGQQGVEQYGQQGGQTPTYY